MFSAAWDSPFWDSERMLLEWYSLQSMGDCKQGKTGEWMETSTYFEGMKNMINKFVCLFIESSGYLAALSTIYLEGIDFWEVMENCKEGETPGSGKAKTHTLSNLKCDEPEEKKLVPHHIATASQMGCGEGGEGMGILFAFLFNLCIICMYKG